jgi:hypothetical protein
MPDDPTPLYAEENVMRHAEEQEALRKTTDRSTALNCIAWFCIIVFLFLIIWQRIWPRRGVKMDMTHAISNAKQVYLVLSDFEADYGFFPDDQTALKDPAISGFTGRFSNDYLGQLIAGGYTRSEEIFYALDKRYGGKKTDNVLTPDSRILVKNECGFSYVLVEENGKRRGLNTKDNGAIPILVAPLVNEWGSCEKSAFDNRGVYLRVDGAARSERLRPSDQKIRLPGGITLFDTGPTSYWGSLKPVVLLPER